VEIWAFPGFREFSGRRGGQKKGVLFLERFLASILWGLLIIPLVEEILGIEVYLNRGMFGGGNLGIALAF